MSRAALALAVVACALACYAAFGKAAPSKGNSVVAAAEAYVNDVGSQNSFEIKKQVVQAVRETGDDAVVKETVTYVPYFQPVPHGPKLYGPVSTVTLSVHLHKGEWSVGYANAS